MSEVVHVAYLQDNLASDYNCHTATAMLSMLEYCSKHAVIHLFHEEILSQENIPKREEEMNKYRKMVSEYDAEIHFHNVTFPKELEKYANPGENGCPNRWRRIIFTRYFIQDFLPEVDRIIVLGSDTIVRTDVSKLLKSMPEKYSIGAVPLYTTSSKIVQMWNKIIFKKTMKPFISAGLVHEQRTIGCVHLFNLKKIRETNILPTKALTLYQKYPNKYLIDDQVLSTVFHDDIYLLEGRFNYHWNDFAKTKEDFDKYLQTFADSELKGYILHFATPIKPWDAINTIYDLEYWDSFYNTPWGKDDMNYVELKKAISTFDQMYSSIEEILWYRPFNEKIRILWNLGLPLFFKLLKRYI